MVFVGGLMGHLIAASVASFQTGGGVIVTWSVMDVDKTNNDHLGILCSSPQHVPVLPLGYRRHHRSQCRKIQQSRPQGSLLGLACHEVLVGWWTDSVYRKPAGCQRLTGSRLLRLVNRPAQHPQKKGGLIRPPKTLHPQQGHD